MTFFGWSLDLAGTTNPLPFSLSNQVIGTANFNSNLANAPLSITTISPVTSTVTSAAVDITINGTGFVAPNGGLQQTFTYFSTDGVNYNFRPVTFNSSTQLVMHLQAGDIATAGYYQYILLTLGGGCNPEAFGNVPVANSVGPPLLGITKSHTGNFGQGQLSATYTVLVTNNGTGGTSGTVTVTETVPSGETLVSMSGSNWNCSTLPTCTRSDSLGVGRSYDAITVTVNVAANATSPQVNTAMVSGGDAGSATATDSTTIIFQVSVPNVVGDTQSAATTAIQNAGLVLGTVTMASSNTVPSGDVISESPSAGTMVNSGTAVNLVVSTGTATLQSIAVTPANPSIVKGQTEQFTATGTYSDNSTQNLTNSVTWASATTSVATINSTGLATSVGVGTSNISATMGSIVGSTVLTVTSPTLVSIAVTPANPTVPKGTSQQFTATGTYSDTTTQNITTTVTWASATTSVATITTGGIATAVAATGTSTISATLNSIVGSTVLTATTPTLVSIAVTPANPTVPKGTSQQFTATGTYSDTTTQNITATATWASATTSVATITTGGIATAVAATGTSTISATLNSIVGSTVLTAAPPTLQSIAVTPANPTVPKGTSQQFTATGTYSDTTTQNITTTVTWASGTTSVATITSTAALATAVAATGTSTISATLNSIVGSTVLTAAPPTLRVDRRDASESHRTQGNFAAIHRYRNLQRYHHAEHQQHRHMGLGNHFRCHHHQHRFSDRRSRHRHQHHQRNTEFHRRLHSANSNHADPRVDRRDSGQSHRTQGHFAAIHSHWNLQR